MKELHAVKQFKKQFNGHWTGIENLIKAGCPDYSVSYAGQQCWIEFKRLYGRDIIVRPLQRVWMIDEIQHYSKVYVAWLDKGPHMLHASVLLSLPYEIKRGKLHYDVKHNTQRISGWSDIKRIVFGVIECQIPEKRC